MNLNGISIGSTNRASDGEPNQAGRTPVAAAYPAAQPSGIHDAFSSNTPSAASLTRTALQTTALRQAKVDALNRLVATASYQLDNAKIAAALANSAL